MIMETRKIGQMIKKRDLQRLQRMLKDFKYEVYDMADLHRCLWHDMEHYLEALIEEEFENDEL